MEPQRFWIHLTLGLTVSVALSIANLVSGDDAGSGKSEGHGGLPPHRESPSPLRGPSTNPQDMPSTGQTNETKAKKGATNDERAWERGPSDHDSATSRENPSSHAEKHPNYERMNADNKKALDKESY